MTGNLRPIRTIRRALRRLRRDQNGASMVEYSIVLGLFLLLFFALIDFGRLAYSFVLAEKAVQIAARTAAVRPPVCAGVPAVNLRPDPVPPGSPAFGADCGTAGGICAAVDPVTCLASEATAGSQLATANEIWTRIETLMPTDATRANLRFTYADGQIGFLGGPYVPLMTVEIVGLNFEFVSPLGALAGLAGGTATTLGEAPITFPRISVSITGEDLMQGGG